MLIAVYYFIKLVLLRNILIRNKENYTKFHQCALCKGLLTSITLKAASKHNRNQIWESLSVK